MFDVVPVELLFADEEGDNVPRVMIMEALPNDTSPEQVQLPLLYAGRHHLAEDAEQHLERRADEVLDEHLTSTGSRLGDLAKDQ